MKQQNLFYAMLMLLLMVLLPQKLLSATYCGSCGENANWALDSETGILSITGTGAMNNYLFSDVPWGSYRSYIKNVSIASGITSIGNNAFRYCSYLTSINIPEGVTRIGYAAFENCSSLASIKIPMSITDIGDCFMGCTSLPVEGNLRYADTYLVGAVDKTLTTYTIKPGTKIIGSEAFSNCSSLASITIPEGVTSIEEEAFSHCSSLASITIPEGVTSIGNYAFSECSSLASINIPQSLTTFGIYPFQYCTSLPVEGNLRYADTYLVGAVDKTLTTYTIKPGTRFIGSNAFGRSELTSITIPESVTNIEYSAFSDCIYLETIIIPATVKVIGNCAFHTCSPNVIFLSATPPILQGMVFVGNATIHVPAGSKSEYKAVLDLNVSNLYAQIVEDIDINLNDGVPYDNSTTANYSNVTFTKTFSESQVSKWNALYVPISIDVEEYAGELDFAELYAFCATVDTNNDGTVDADDENFLFVRPVNTGRIKPNLPYAVRPHEAKTYTINSADDVLYKAEAGTVEFSTALDKYTVTGLYSPFTVTAGDNNYYVSSTGELNRRTEGSVTVKANRWVMHRESKEYGGGDNADAQQAKSYSIVAIGEDMSETTAIELIKTSNGGTSVNTGIYTLDGRKVNDSHKLVNGIYIKNGKKFVVK